MAKYLDVVSHEGGGRKGRKEREGGNKNPASFSIGPAAAATL